MTALARQLIERALPQDEPQKSGANPQQKSARIARPTRSVTVNLSESPLSWLKARGLLSELQYAAGEQLRLDYERASLGARVTMCWDAPPTSRTARGAPDPGGQLHHQLNAKARFDAAIGAAGAGLADILWRVVCGGEGVPVAEKALGWPARSGRLVLGMALDRLADHYRMR